MTESNVGLPADAERFVLPSHFVESDSLEVQGFVTSALRDLPADATDRDKAIRLFEAVRDDIRYDPYCFALDEESYRASKIAGAEAAFCVPKAILLAACLRAVGIPAALGFADVRNHLNTPKLQELMGTDLFIYHGYVQLWLDGEPYKVTPAFNMELCERFGVKPLIFDGYHDALFHEFDEENQRHMEYVNDRGLYFDAPIAEFLTAFKATYPKLEEFNRIRISRDASGYDSGFAKEEAREVSGGFHAWAGVSLSQCPDERRFNKGVRTPVGSATAAHGRRLCGRNSRWPDRLGLSDAAGSLQAGDDGNDGRCCQYRRHRPRQSALVATRAPG